MSASLGCPVSTLTWSTQSTGPVGPDVSDLEVGLAVPCRRRGRSNAGEAKRGGATTGFVGKRLQGTGKSAARRVRMTTRPRVEWWWPERLVWPKLGAMASPAATRSGELRRRQCGAFVSE